MILYFSRNINPRLAVAAARHMNAPITYEFAAPFAPNQQERFRRLNPSLRIPILVDGDKSLWEADAIACRLSEVTGTNFWRTGPLLSETVRWLSWAHNNFVRACDLIHFEHVTKQRYGLGPIRSDLVNDGMQLFDESAKQLDDHLGQQDWLIDDAVSYADFRMACFLPYGDLAGIPFRDYSNIAAWNERLMSLLFWRDPFAELHAPELPPVKSDGLAKP
jgi:glutathione S-transferase